MLTATNILWDFDKEELYEKLDTMPIKEATESIGITPQRYTDMTKDTPSPKRFFVTIRHG